MRYYKTVIALFSVVLAVVLFASQLLAQIPGALIELDATRGAGEHEWKNFGAAGGEFPAGPNGAPNLDPAQGQQPACYTGDAGKIFGTDPPSQNTPTMHLESWTIEMHLKRNGPAFADEHQIAGFRSFEPRHGQRIDIHFSGQDTGAIDINIKGLNTDPVTHKETLDIGSEEWHRIAFVYNEAANALQSYLDGKPIKRLTTKQDFDSTVEMNFHSLFDSHVPEHGRSFNGSMSLVRVYDKALTDGQIVQNFEGRAIKLVDKLATTLGRLKSRY